MAAAVLSKDIFEEKILKNKELAVVDFWAPWCTYCRRIEPAYEKIGSEYEDKLLVGKVNIDDDLLSGKRQQISVLSERLKELRKEVRLCNGIAERSGVIRENLNAVLADEEKIKNNRKENRDYEHRR